MPTSVVWGMSSVRCSDAFLPYRIGVNHKDNLPETDRHADAFPFLMQEIEAICQMFDFPVEVVEHAEEVPTDYSCLTFS